MKRDSRVTRTSALLRLSTLPAAILFALTGQRPRSAKGSKAALRYQDTPNGNQRCARCSYFISGATPSTDGTCRIVEGSISPHGWCSAFSQKS